MLDDSHSDIGEAKVAFARSHLQAAERILFREMKRRHEKSLCSLDELSVFEGLLRTVDLGLQLLKLQVACGRESERCL